MHYIDRWKNRPIIKKADLSLTLYTGGFIDEKIQEIIFPDYNKF